jgi:hypothetical protein
MMAEIFARGPIAATVAAPKNVIYIITRTTHSKDLTVSTGYGADAFYIYLLYNARSPRRCHGRAPAIGGEVIT